MRYQASAHEGFMVEVPRLPALLLGERAQAATQRGVRMFPMNGVPVLPMPEHVQAAVRAAAGQVFDRHSRGHATLRTAIAEDLVANHGVAVDPDVELLITHGAQHGMSIALRALLEPGDEVIIPAPTYLFDGMVRLSGARPVYVPCSPAAGWALDPAAVEAAVTSASRAILLCNPNNPTGAVPSLPQLSALLALAARHGLLVFSDESYARYVNSGERYTPQHTLHGLHDRLITVTSLSKNYAFTNWRVGFVHAPRPLLQRIHAGLEWEAINVGDVPQVAAHAVIAGPQEWITSVLAQYQHKRDVLMAAVRGAGLDFVEPGAGVFLSVDFTSWGLHGRALEDELMRRGVVALALDAFAGPADHARLLYGGEPDSLQAVGRALAGVPAAAD